MQSSNAAEAPQYNYGTYLNTLEDMVRIADEMNLSIL